MIRIAPLFVVLALAAEGPAPAAQPLSLLRTAPVAKEARWDCPALDSTAKRFYFPRAASVMVLDLEGRAVGEVPGTPGIQAVALAPELGIGFTSNGRNQSVSVFNLATLVVEKKLRTTGADPGAIVFDPATRRIFAFNQGGRNATAFDAFGGAVVASIPLDGQPGAAVGDGTGRLFVALKDSGEVAVLDARKLAVLRRWRLPGPQGDRTLALDPGRGRLFVAGPGKALVILDTGTGVPLANLALAEPAAALACDPGTGRAYLAGAAGGLTTLQADAGGRFTLETIPVGVGPCALILDEHSHLLYLPTASPVPVGQTGRGSGVFHIQVVGPS